MGQVSSASDKMEVSSRTNQPHLHLLYLSVHAERPFNDRNIDSLKHETLAELIPGL